MITCKEDLNGTKIKFKANSELVDVYITHCIKYGVSIMGTMSREEAVDHATHHDADYLCVYNNNLFYRPRWGMLDNCSRSVHMAYPADFKELTLEDFLLHEKALESSVSNTNIHTHKDVKPHTEAPAPLIVEDGSVCDTRKDVFKEIITLARENNCFIQFDGFTEDDNDTIVVTFRESDEEYVVKNVDDFRKLCHARETMNKFVRGV